MKLSETYSKVRSACAGIAIEVNDEKSRKYISIGSGACVHPSGIVVTAKHVITSYYREVKGEQLSEEAIMSDPDFRIIFANRGTNHYIMRDCKPISIFMSEDTDVALIKIQEIDEGWPSFELPSTWDINEGDEIATAGYPLRDINDAAALPNLFSGIVSRFDGKYDDKGNYVPENLLLDLSIHPGNSGGPVFEMSTGKLIGIIEAQKLRSADILSMINKLKQNSNEEDTNNPDDSINVWTNIAYCVPWMSIKSGIDQILEENISK